MSATRRRHADTCHDPVFAAMVHRQARGRDRRIYAVDSKAEVARWCPSAEQEEKWDEVVEEHLREAARGKREAHIPQRRLVSKRQVRAPRDSQEQPRRMPPPQPTMMTPPPFLQPPSCPPELLPPQGQQPRRPPPDGWNANTRRAASAPEGARRTAPHAAWRTSSGSVPGVSPSADYGAVPRASSSSGPRVSRATSSSPAGAYRASPQDRPPKAAWCDPAAAAEGADQQQKEIAARRRGGQWIWGSLLGRRSEPTPEEVAAALAAEDARRVNLLIDEVERTLGRTRNMPAGERKKVFRELQRRFHPDKNAECAEISKLVFQRLMDSRRSYLQV